MEGKVNAPIMNLIAVLGEVDLFTEWIPETELSANIKEVSPMRRSVYLITALPWPLWKRENFVEAGCYIMKEHKALGISIESIRGDTWFGEELIRSPETMVENDVKKGFFCIEYIDEATCRLKIFLNVDPHLGFIPVTLMNFFMKNIASKILDFVKTTAENLPEKYKERL